MRKIPILVIVSLLILIGFYFYTSRRNSALPALLRDLIPTDAVLVIEQNQHASRTSPEFTELIQAALKQDSLFVRATRSGALIASVHITGKENLGITYYFPDSAILKSKFIATALASSGKRRKRVFEGFTINDLSTSDGTCSWVTLGPRLIISHESLLIEDVIRTAKNRERKDTKDDVRPRLQHITDTNLGSLYINLELIGRFINLFVLQETRNNFVNYLGKGIAADFKFETGTLSLNGSATDSAATVSSLSMFNDQHAVPFALAKVVSNRSLFCVRYGISDFTSWAKRRQTYSNAHQATSPREPEPQLPFNSTEFYKALGSEIGTCRLETAGHIEDLLIVEIKTVAIDDLNRMLANNLPSVENYANYPIRKLSIKDLPCRMLWPLTENRNLSFYAKYNKYLLFSENIESLKKYIDDLEDENTWGKSSDWNSFFSSTPPENNVSFIFNGTLLYPSLLNELVPQWRMAISSVNWSNIRRGLFQFTRLDRNFDFSGTIQVDLNGKTRNSKGTPNPELTFSQNVTRLTWVKDQSRRNGLAVQISDHKLFLVSPDFKIQFQIELTDNIRGELHPIDFFKNRKLQYLFLAGHDLYLVDRLGKSVKGFPRRIASSTTPEFLSVVDYDNSRNYRFMLADEKGNLYMTDKDGKLLNGWEGKATGARFFGPPRQVRITGKDFIVGVDGGGKVYVFNRKGESARGFPANLAVKPGGDWFFEKGNSLDESWITVVGTDGTKAQVNLNGKMATKENFVRSSPQSKFSLVPAPSLTDFVVCRVDKGKIAILNSKGKILFEKENPGSEDLEPGYLEFGNGGKLFCFRDAPQEFTYVFSERGDIVFANPLETTLMPVINQAGERAGVYAAYKNRLRKNFP